MKSHGDGRRMTVEEAVERRSRMIRVHGSLRKAWQHGARTINAMEFGQADELRGNAARWWNGWRCTATVGTNQRRCFAVADAAEDVALVGAAEQPTAVCSRCRSAQR